ncbi:MAG: AI-2E family transporter [Gammaproteobacteria bacterium]|nr:AI-2E family transporter [Gammaproteobacteria bacterium]MDH3560081.1 AI-2E family transporter [Gammaproteobacteria bacterium]
MYSIQRLEMVAAIALLSLLLIGTVVVLKPFIISLILAAVLAYATWPVYEWLLARLRNRPGAAATAMTLLLLLTLVTPFAVMGVSLADNAVELLRLLREALNRPLPPPPHWLEGLPLAGGYLQGKWLSMMQEEEGTLLLQVREQLQQLPLRNWAITAGAALVQGVVLISFSVLICFFFYRDGPAITTRVQAVMERLTGHRARNLIEVTAGTVSRVVNGILGTSLAQSVLALIGFWIADVPGAMLLGLLTFFLSIMPMGPPLVWVPAVVWLYIQGSTAMAVFLAIWGLLLISSIDNFIKPYLISRGGSLPLLLVFMGVLGGLLAFGFIGVFLGPVILAVTYALLTEWASSTRPADAGDDAAGD